MSLFSNEKLECYGATLSENLVVTTARCAMRLKNDPAKEKIVKAGIVQQRSYKSLEETISKFIIHPRYDGRTKANNIALVAISRESTGKAIGKKSVGKLPSPGEKLNPNTNGKVPVLSLPPGSESIKLFSNLIVKKFKGRLNSENKADGFVASLQTPVLARNICGTLFASEPKKSFSRGTDSIFCTDQCCETNQLLLRNMREGRKEHLS